MKVLSFSRILMCLAVFLNACSNSKSKNLTETRNYLNSQVAERIRIIEDLPKDSVTERPDVSALDKRLNEIILISKDVENIQASVSLANEFFEGLSEKYRFHSADFVLLNSGMHIDEIEILIKQNELSFFNQYILRFSGRQLTLPAAR